ncbi:hypothetical protein D3C76_1577980 [compost metagenome]
MINLKLNFPHTNIVTKIPITYEKAVSFKPAAKPIKIPAAKKAQPPPASIFFTTIKRETNTNKAITCSFENNPNKEVVIAAVTPMTTAAMALNLYLSTSNEKLAIK